MGETPAEPRDPTHSHLSLDDVGVYLGDSVDGVRAHDAQVRHVDPLAPVLFNQGHCPQLVHVFGIQSRDPLRAQKQTPVSRGEGSPWNPRSA